jgi:hypothetical protein
VSTGFSNAMRSAWNAITTALPKAMQAAAGATKAAFRGVLQWIASRINTVAGLINRLIVSYNRLPAPDIPLIPILTVPAFAQGGVVDRPTLIEAGEGGEREYVVPESKMAAASSRFLAGQRGASVIPSSASSGGSSGGSIAPAGPVQITIKTGPVMQSQDGQRWMTIEDGERMARQAVEQMQRISRTPGGRYAMGVR